MNLWNVGGAFGECEKERECLCSVLRGLGKAGGEGSECGCAEREPEGWEVVLAPVIS